MPATSLSVTLIQPNIVWEGKAANLQHYDSLIAAVKEKMEVVILPEMFSTGFVMKPAHLAEAMDGPTVQWMKATAARRRIIMAGSIIMEDGGRFYNRLLWVQPDGAVHHYDKRHRFSFAGEDEHYTAGDKRVIVQVKGWKILLQVCYDLRFPVFARNRKDAPYDLLLYVANWPEKRALAWNTLLAARAIENQSYVVGVNRVGDDPNGISHCGDSAVYGPVGNILYKASANAETVHTIVLDGKEIEDTREKLPFLRDADDFLLQ